MPENLTANGNPKGTITNGQIMKIYALAHVFSHSKEDLDKRCMERFGTRISGLSKEDASIVIENYERTISEKTSNS